MSDVATVSLELRSDTALAGLRRRSGIVDIDVVHDDDGLVYIPGRRLKGLLRDAWRQMSPHFPELEGSALALFGGPGETGWEAEGRDFSDAVLPDDVASWLRWAVRRSSPDPAPLSPVQVLDGLTVVRHTTARDRALGGAPADGSLRAVRLVRRGLRFESTVLLGRGVERDRSARVLAMAASNLRELGLGRSRGRGWVTATMSAEANDGQSHDTRWWVNQCREPSR